MTLMKLPFACAEKALRTGTSAEVSVIADR